jgi:hypothetical protein
MDHPKQIKKIDVEQSTKFYKEKEKSGTYSSIYAYIKQRGRRQQRRKVDVQHYN